MSKHLLDELIAIMDKLRIIWIVNKLIPTCWTILILLSLHYNYNIVPVIYTKIVNWSLTHVECCFKFLAYIFYFSLK